MSHDDALATWRDAQREAVRLALTQDPVEVALSWRAQQSRILSRLGCPVVVLSGFELAQRRLEGWA